MHVDRAFLDVHAAAPDVVEQLGARVHAIGMGHEEMQQPVFGRADLHRPLAAVALRQHPMGGAVDAQVADLDVAVLVVLAGAAHDGLDPGKQLARGEGLDHVVVDPGLQATDAVVLLAARREHDDRDVAGEFLAAPAPRQLQAARARQHPVQQDEVGDAVGNRHLRLPGIAGVHRLVVAMAQREGDHVADRGFVVDDEDVLLHGRCLRGPHQ